MVIDNHVAFVGLTIYGCTFVALFMQRILLYSGFAFKAGYRLYHVVSLIWNTLMYLD